MSGPVLPARRPSRLNVIADQYHSGTGSHSRTSSMPTVSPSGTSSGLYDTSAHYVLRVPSLFRIRVPLIALVPIFLLGFFLIPVSKLDPDTSDYAYSRAQALDRIAEEAAVQAAAARVAPGSKGWKERFLPNSFSRQTTNTTLNEHFTESDGLLYFPPAASQNNFREGVAAARASQPKQRHPILHLIEQAERKWEDLLNRQSTTLDGAVAEYRRRYQRAPPKGFEKWWAFAQKHNIQLVDEYDQINIDIEPFLALPPRVFKARNHQLASDPTFGMAQQSFTINVKSGKVEITGPYFEMARAIEISELIGFFAESLPDLQATFTAHDGPAVMMSGEAKKRYLETARAGRVLREEEAETVYDPAEYPGFIASCPPGSKWRKSLAGWSLPTPSTHSFITDVTEASDVCKHPNLAFQHGFFSWNGPRMGALYPLFTWAKTGLNSDILVTPLEQYYTAVGPDPAWEDKRFNKLLWRGSNTGAAFHRDSRWRSSQRVRLVLMTSDKEGDRVVHWADDKGVLRASTEPLVDLNERYTDVGFAGKPAQCEDWDGTCQALLNVFEWKGNMGLEESNHYKYILDMDGNGWSGRFHRLMASNSAVLKSTVMPEWYQERVMPWVHFIPVKVDYTDLYDILGFFIGSPDGDNGHDDLGRKIALQGQQWAEHHWRLEDMQAYMFRLLLEYGRLLSRTEDDLQAGDYTS